MIAAAEPQLFVPDIRAAYAFYMEKLGFAVVFAYGEPPYYGQVKRDRAWLNLRCVGVPVIDPALRDKEEMLSATLMVNTAPEIEQLFLEFQAAGRRLRAAARGETLGRQGFHRQGPRRQPAAICRPHDVAIGVLGSRE